MEIWCDGSSRNNQKADHRISACRIVTEDGHTETYELGGVSNNIAELEAILRALRYAWSKNCRSVTIYSDSRCALAWVKKGPARKLPAEKRAEVQKILDEIETLIPLFKSIHLQQIRGEDQRADFGYK